MANAERVNLIANFAVRMTPLVMAQAVIVGLDFDDATIAMKVLHFLMVEVAKNPEAEEMQLEERGVEYAERLLAQLMPAKGAHA
jgi:hypothetical protein